MNKIVIGDDGVTRMVISVDESVVERRVITTRDTSLKDYIIGFKTEPVLKDNEKLVTTIGGDMYIVTI